VFPQKTEKKSPHFRGPKALEVFAEINRMPRSCACEKDMVQLPSLNLNFPFCKSLEKLSELNKQKAERFKYYQAWTCTAESVRWHNIFPPRGTVFASCLALWASHL
jgi:hypothetical protein